MAPTSAERRPVARAVALGLLAAVAAGAMSVAAIALPLFFLARALDPANGTGRPLIHDGLVIVLPVAAVVGLLVGPLVGAWYRRGGRLPREDDGFWRS
jgi:hypothetical protein